ncbi:MAG: GNAT family N-acetyltransferase [Minisyncoccota bacterium]
MEENSHRVDFSCKVDNYHTKTLPQSELDQLQRLYTESNDYFQLVLNRDVLPSDSTLDFNSVPEGKTLEDKFIYGVFKSEKLVGVIDLIRDYPDQNTWFIGLLLLTPSERGNNLGKKIFNVLAGILINVGAQKIRISVVNQNIRALDFWIKIGFKESGRGHEGESSITYFDYTF